jgi:putative PIN family toxin of toxin-antitoxin system
MALLRVVLDTNCLVSALVFSRSRLASLRTHWQASRYIPLGCEETVNELIRVLIYPKFELSKEEIEQLLGDILPFLETCKIHGAYDAIDGLRDPSDAVFMHLAQQAQADVLVSGDEDILALQGKISRLAISGPADFLHTLEKTLNTTR